MTYLVQIMLEKQSLCLVTVTISKHFLSFGKPSVTKQKENFSTSSGLHKPYD